MGFCLVNNIAITAASLIENGEKVAVIDIDAHHGNGTQDIFYSDSRVLMISIHQWPLYPGTGAEGEIGESDGKGFNVNVPLPPASTGGTYRAALDEIVSPCIDNFEPDWIRYLPVLMLTDRSTYRHGTNFGDFGDLLTQIFNMAPKGRCIFFLEALRLSGIG